MPALLPEDCPPSLFSRSRMRIRSEGSRRDNCQAVARPANPAPTISVSTSDDKRFKLGQQLRLRLFGASDRAAGGVVVPAAAVRLRHMRHIDAVTRAQGNTEALPLGLAEDRRYLHALDRAQVVGNRVDVGQGGAEIPEVLLVDRGPGDLAVLREFGLRDAPAGEPGHRAALLPVGLLDQVLEFDALLQKITADLECLRPDVREPERTRIDDDGCQEARGDGRCHLDLERFDEFVDDLADGGRLVLEDLDLAERLPEIVVVYLDRCL